MTAGPQQNIFKCTSFPFILQQQRIQPQRGRSSKCLGNFTIIILDVIIRLGSLQSVGVDRPAVSYVVNRNFTCITRVSNSSSETPYRN